MISATRLKRARDFVMLEGRYHFTPRASQVMDNLLRATWTTGDAIGKQARTWGINHCTSGGKPVFIHGRGFPGCPNIITLVPVPAGAMRALAGAATRLAASRLKKTHHGSSFTHSRIGRHHSPLPGTYQGSASRPQADASPDHPYTRRPPPQKRTLQAPPPPQALS